MHSDGIVGGDICGLGLQPDYINMTCSINYRGSEAPTLSWSQDNGDDLTQHVTNSLVQNSTVTSTVLITANERTNGSWFTCSAGRTQLNTSEVLEVFWASPAVTQLCMYIWS